jgi:hypothetical protein
MSATDGASVRERRLAAAEQAPSVRRSIATRPRRTTAASARIQGLSSRATQTTIATMPRV